MNQSDAARVVVSTITRMASEGRPLMARVLPAEDVHYWDHFPDDDARDSVTKSRWYYHVHAPGDRDPSEHGHFHLFLHRSQIAANAQARSIPAEGEEAAAHVTHIAGLAIDHHGIPIRWFATNRWVTDEFMYPAQTVIDHLDRYNVDRTDEDPMVNQLMTAMVALYRDELADLLRERDRRLDSLVADKGPSAFEEANDVLATRSIDLDAKIGSFGLF